MEPLTCIGRDGASRTFYLKGDFDPLDEHWFFMVFASPEGVGDFFSFKFKVLEGDIWQQIGIFRPLEDIYAAKGIPDAVLPYLKRNYGVQIVSSSTCGESSPGEEAVWRSDDATKMWKRLVGKDLAAHHKETDTFYLL